MNAYVPPVPDREVSLVLPGHVAARLDAMAEQYGLTVAEIVRHLAGNVASLMDALPAAVKRSALAARKETS